ncbi:MAG TPA: TetR/AcrR family transcriptional regulator [Thermoanaerobaculia bacterium]|nr:TetR/AcrR family transcriptional regulator [Thermoanaerobaculia bacterium]
MKGQLGKRTMEKKGVGRPRDGNPEETRREILRAGGESFAACGFVGATTRAVAARAGVNVATLHYHFGSKEGLYRAVLENANKGTLPVVSSGPGRETVSSLVEGLFVFGSERPTLARLALLDTLAGPEPRNGTPSDQRVRWLAEALGRILVPSNGRPAADPEETARSVVALVDATFLAAAPRPAHGETPGTGAVAGKRPAPPPLPDDAARGAVVAAALRLSGLG